MAYIAIDPITIRMEGPLHIGAGHRRGLIDRAILLDNSGQAYVPGATIKGKARDACERLSDAVGLNPCYGPNPSKKECVPGRRCLVCRVFGRPGGRQDETQELYWDNAYLTQEVRDAADGLPLRSERTHASLSRQRQVASEGRLFSEEVAPNGLTFTTRITGYLPLLPVLDEPKRYYEIILLVAGLKLVDRIGGTISRGAGRCTIDIPDGIVEVHRAGEVETLSVDWILDRLELLELYRYKREEAG